MTPEAHPCRSCGAGEGARDMSATAVKRLHYIQNELRAAQQRVADIEREAQKLNQTIDTLLGWEGELLHAVCRACNGYGKIRKWYAQDESELITCDSCKGTGIP